MPGAPKAGRRRRGQTLLRLAAYAAPVVVLASAVTAGTLRGWWMIIGLATGVLASGLLAAIVLYLERRSRAAVAATRAKLAAQYNAEQARYAAEHRSFTEHMVNLLDMASVRISVLRRRVDSLEREVATTRFLQRTRPVLAHELSAYGKSVTNEWPDLWPEFTEAPTVVDFVAWDQRTRTESTDDGPLLASGQGAPGDGHVDDAYSDDHENGEPEQKSA